MAAFVHRLQVISAERRKTEKNAIESHTRTLAVPQMHLHSSGSNRPFDRFKLTSRWNQVPFGASGCVKFVQKVDETRIVEHVLAAERTSHTSHMIQCMGAHQCVSVKHTSSSNVKVFVARSLSLRPSCCNRISTFQ